MRCLAPDCGRGIKGAGRLCDRCLKALPPPLLLALHDHIDWMRAVENIPIHGFIGWSMNRTWELAAWEAQRMRAAKRSNIEPDETWAYFEMAANGEITQRRRLNGNAVNFAREAVRVD